MNIPTPLSWISAVAVASVNACAHVSISVLHVATENNTTKVVEQTL